MLPFEGVALVDFGLFSENPNNGQFEGMIGSLNCRINYTTMDPNPNQNNDSRVHLYDPDCNNYETAAQNFDSF